MRGAHREHKTFWEETMNLKSGQKPQNLVGVAVRRSLLAAAVVAGGALPPSISYAADEPAMEEVIVTGSILRRTDTETPSPVTVLSSESLEERGINTISEAVQRLSANNAGTIQQGWNTGFNFASGANAPALRGLTVQATLSVFDGLRMAPYPLADDGQRNFVDLNSIPSAIIDKIEVLRDGASSTYGADAIAGVINIITKKEIQGFHLGGNYAMSEEGGADENAVDLTWGFGDLESQGFNFYISGEYSKTEALWARERDYPFNSQDLTRVCKEDGSTCMQNLNWNGVTPEMGVVPAAFNGLITVPGVSLVRPVAPGANTGGGRYQYLNPTAGCRTWDTTTIDPTQSGVSPTTICEIPFQSEFIMLQPEVKRQGLSMRFTTNIGDNAQLYAMGNFYKTDTFAAFTPLGFNGNLPPPNPVGVAAANVILPTYVCPQGVGTFNGANTGCTAANGVLNPYNPFTGGTANRAQLLLRSPFPRTVETSSRAIRGVLGIEGSFGDDWSYTGSFTTSEVGLTLTQKNYLIPQRIWDVAAKGTFNFFDPMANSEDMWDYIAPENEKYAPSRLWQAQGTIAKSFMDLPGGALQAAAGIAYREESINAPSGNPGDPSAPFTRYFSVNAVGTAGSRDVKSAFFEVSAPVLKQLELAASGRFDDYSTGQSKFSPKVGFKFTPIEQLALRGTWSQGFRIPSFNEAFGLPTTGYVNRQVDCAQYVAFCAEHQNNSYVSGNYSLGLTQVGNPELDPEESESFTVGLVIEPIRNLSFTLDYWNIEVENLITGVTSTAGVEDAYYSNGGVVNIPGYNAVPGVPDPQFPGATPLLGFIETSYANQDSQEVSGIDLGANFSLPIGDTVTWRSFLEVSYLANYDLKTDAGVTLSYEGTLSPCNITSCSGAPQYRGMWQNTLEFGGTSLSLTGYWTSGYATGSADFIDPTVQDVNVCADTLHASTLTYVNDDPVNCYQSAQWNADFTARHTFSDKYTVYLDVLNVFSIKPEFDPSAAYSLFNYNPAWGGPNMVGRYFRLGVQFDF
jgi:iron complex outermembrane receptor protein